MGGLGVIFISLLVYMFQSILHILLFCFCFGGENLFIFMDGGVRPTLLTENSTKVLPSSTPTSIQLQLQLELRIALISF